MKNNLLLSTKLYCLECQREPHAVMRFLVVHRNALLGQSWITALELCLYLYFTSGAFTTLGFLLIFL